MTRVRLALVGDVNCKDDAGCRPALAPSAVACLDAADVRIGNLEGAFADPSVELPYKRGWFHCEPSMLGLVRGHFDALACANNVHYGEAIAASGSLLDDAGIAHTGAGASASEALTPAVVARGDACVGLLAFTSVFWPVGHAASPSRPGVATIRVATAYEPHWRVREMPGGPATVRTIPDEGDLESALERIRRLRSEVDVVVVYFHWGVSLSHETAEYQRVVGRRAVEAGADVVVGSHPHVVQGVERWGDGLILYSLGNFVFGWRLHREATREGLLARVDAGGARPWRCALVPVRRNRDNAVEALSLDSAHGARIAATAARLSEPLGTRLARVGDELVVQPPAG